MTGPLTDEVLTEFAENVSYADGPEVRAMANELLVLRPRVAELETQLARVRETHQPVDALNIRHHPNGRLTRVCSGCGTDDGNWQIYPCPTIRALEVQS
ncbi:hypothetical protein [Nocardia sp. NPDC057227]|uniref:hypothetical protein n=1 Tax=Nocardia sp. NPDC057227 TaxID=3346056 RepID=UPI00363C01D0